ncbi:MAG: hypothetical protein WBD07_13575 [Vicinamibacterales bacterium]
MTRRSLSMFVALAAVAFGSGRLLAGQGRAGQPGQAPAPPPTARTTAPIDLTGSWVSIVTEDWRWRMVTPAKGDYQSVPITAEGKRVADMWDPAKDEAAGEQCRSYGAAGLMRVPGRLRISWQDENTLKVETDAGMQTRLFHFGAWKAPAPARPSWQGDSVAEWETGGRGGPTTGSAPGTSDGGGRRFGNLKVVTTHMRPGYLRKNGVPYSADAVLTEYWDLYRETNGDQYIVITTYVDDPKYLQQTYVTSPNFQKESDGSKWDPTPCSARW